MKFKPPTSSPFPAQPRVVGERVDDGCGSIGTIRYVGPVPTAKYPSALYYGIEWDDWGRGKNDGSVELLNGQRVVVFAGPAGRGKLRTGDSGSKSTVFKCSFVKSTKVDEMPKPATLFQRLQERYCTVDSNFEPGVGDVDVVVTGEVQTTLGSEKPIEFVGAKKLRTQQTLQTIEMISLSGCQVAELGIRTNGESLKTMTPRLTELDLSKNLFRTWNDVVGVVRELPLLKTLILSGNRFAVDEENVAEGGSDVFESVKVLVLNQTLLSWKQVGKLVTRHFPKLEELHLVDNEYGDEQLSVFQQSGSWTKMLKVLDLSLNDFVSWNRLLCTVGEMFVNLSQLILNGNRIATLVTDRDSHVARFQKLTTLSLSDNRVNSWTSIDSLNAFPLLDTLRFSKNPLTSQMSPGEARMLIIARTDHVTVFNASLVRDKERAEAEQLYLKRILHELAVVAEKACECERVLAAHPRYVRLRKMYPEISVDQNDSVNSGGSTAGPRKLASSLVKVRIIPMSMQATSLQPLVKRIPQQMKVSQLKLLIEAKFGVEVPAQSLPMMLDDDSAEDGSEVLVNDSE
uniref:CAP-Gly domain-containing protein n=1 Tax=Hyaloperonospora arabidopsidis (strain Emoy2) TaxID=559515 RepID=M4BWV5_HYAAE